MNATELNKAVREQYMSLPIPDDFYQAEYIWVGGSGIDLRSKGRTYRLSEVEPVPECLKIWNFDGSSTGQAPGNDSEVLLKPQAVFRDPFRRGNNILVICDCYKPDMTPLPGNTRYVASEIFNKAGHLKPWFGLEQEYTLLDPKTNWPYGWPSFGYPEQQGKYYCSVGADCSLGREIAEAHYRACLYAGIKISGINGEVLPSQWEFQIGPAEGLEGGDHMVAARYILHRIAEDFGVKVTFDPKPVPNGDWNGSGCHCNFSTEPMRNDGGYQVILDSIKKLAAKHMEHISVYGDGNERRLTGLHETAPIDKFCYGVANRGASIRIPRDSERYGKGYFEDRRPAANCDPYVVTGLLVKTCCLE